MIDAADKERFKESREEFEILLAEEELFKVPILVLGNKSDLEDAVSEQVLRSKFGLQQTYGKNKRNINARPIEFFMTSVVRRSGFKEGFKWLSQFIQ